MWVRELLLSLSVISRRTMGPDRWEKQMNSRLILGSEVLPSWQELADFLESAYYIMCPGLEDEQIKHKWTGNLFFPLILQHTNSISMFLKALGNENVWWSGTFFGYFKCCLAVNDLFWCGFVGIYCSLKLI